MTTSDMIEIILEIDHEIIDREAFLEIVSKMTDTKCTTPLIHIRKRTFLPGETMENKGNTFEVGIKETGLTGLACINANPAEQSMS